MVKIHQFDPVIYPVKLWVAVTTDGEVIKERFHLINAENFEFNRHDYEAITFPVKQKAVPTYKGFLVVFTQKKCMTVKIMAHEATHVARMMWKHLGEDVTGEEADAYLVGWIASCMNEVKNYKNG